MSYRDQTIGTPDKKQQLLLDTLEPIPCPECGGKLRLRIGEYGLYYRCTKFPACRTTHTAHKKTGKPMGVPANKETRTLRMKAHEAFDKLWVSKRLKYKSRNRAYAWLARRLGIRSADCHIGMFDKAMCSRVIKVCEKREREKSSRGKENKSEDRAEVGRTRRS